MDNKLIASKLIEASRMLLAGRFLDMKKIGKMIHELYNLIDDCGHASNCPAGGDMFVGETVGGLCN